MKIPIGVRARTLSRLRTTQILLRPWGRYAHHLIPRRMARVAPGALERARDWSSRIRPIQEGQWQEQGFRAANGVWRFVGGELCAALPPFRAEAPRLWRYELHYRAWLAGLAELRAQGKLSEETWLQMSSASLDSCRTDSEAWEPYVLARRIPNELAAAGIAGDETILMSAARAAGALRFMPEVHLAANHLLVDRASLALAALVLEGEIGSDAERKFLAECEAQTDADGLHEERSPWYALLAWLDLQNVVAGRAAAGGDGGQPEALGKKQLLALGRLIHQDGSLAAFHDSSSDHPYAALASSLASREDGAWRLPCSGFCGWRGDLLGRSLSLIMDAGEARPRHQPSHQHASPLAIELWWGGPWIRSLGLSTYEASSRRLFERGVRSHATIQIDELEPAEIWSAFRMGRGYRMAMLDYHEIPKGFHAACSHDGFRPGIVSRALGLSTASRTLSVVDRFTPRDEGTHTMKSRLPLAHDVAVRRNGGTIRLERENAFIDLTISSGNSDVTIERERAHPSFGGSVATHVIVVTTRGQGEISSSFELVLGTKT